MSIVKKRARAARTAIAAMTASGVVVGYLLGCVIAIQLAENRLDQYSKLMAVQEDASSVQARSVLAVLNGSQYPHCSNAEIAYFRQVVFRSDYLKDAGRIAGGKIFCSATAGRSMRAMGQLRPGSAQKDGTIAYNNLLPVPDPGLKRAGLQLGTAYVVFGSQVPGSLGPLAMHLFITMKDNASPKSPGLAGAMQDKEPDLTTDGKAQAGDTLYATRCSTLHFNCVTATTTVPEALRGERPSVVGGSVAGGLCGVLSGMAFSVLYRRSRNMEGQLRRAIARDRLQVVYQPIVSLATGRIVGAEALTRWNDEEGNPVSPDIFIKIAEEHGFIGAITRIVVQRALRAFAETLRESPDFRLSVNVAAADLSDPTFLVMLDDTLKRTKVEPRSLALEITEGSTADQLVATETIRWLRRQGHKIYIDDFGTGYSSLSYLQYLAVDTIKIDKAFTRVIGTESASVAILPQIMAMARSLNLEVIVEGIESGHQADYFSSAKQQICGQGWLYGRPVTAEAFHGLLADESSKEIDPAIAEQEQVGLLSLRRHRLA